MSDTNTTAVDAEKVGTDDACNEWTTHWTTLVREWESSGLSQTEFCRQRSIKVTTFNFWKLRILKQTPGPNRHRRRRDPTTSAEQVVKHVRRRPHTNPSTAPFVPVVVRPGALNSEWRCEIACRNGRVIRLRELLPLDEIKALLLILES